MDRKIEREIEKIEETQGRVRDSIEQTKMLAEEADKLLKEHKQALAGQIEG